MSKNKQYELSIKDVKFYDSSPFTFLPDFIVGTFKSYRKAVEASWNALNADGVLSHSIYIRRIR